MKKPAKPSWGFSLRWLDSARCYGVTCMGCGKTIRKYSWPRHPAYCSNMNANEKIIHQAAAIENQKEVKQKPMSSSQGIILQYEQSEEPQFSQLEPVVPLYCTASKNKKISSEDYEFVLTPIKGKCFFKTPIKVSMLPSKTLFEKITIGQKHVCTYTPKLSFHRDKHTLMFVNDFTLPYSERTFLPEQYAMVATEEQQRQEIPKKPRPRSKWCSVCKKKFIDYGRHIKSRIHQEHLANKKGRYNPNWASELHHFIKDNKQNIRQHTIKQQIRMQPPLTHPDYTLNVFYQKKLNKQQARLVGLIAKEINQDSKHLARMIEIKKLSKCEKVRPEMIMSSVKECIICKGRQYQIGVEDRIWLECSCCRAKIHKTCAQSQKFVKCSCYSLCDVGVEINQIQITGAEGLQYMDENIGVSLPYLELVKDYLQSVEQSIVNIWRTRGFKYVRETVFHSTIQRPVRLYYQPFLKIASFDIERAHSLYANGIYLPAIKIKNIGKNVGVGIFAIFPIPKLTFLCEYSGNLIPGTFASLNPEYNMDLLEAASPQASLIITCLTAGGLGPLLNHSNTPNCKSLKCLIKGLPRVILYSYKDIKIGQQLTYSYNGLNKNYPTTGFEQL